MDIEQITKADQYACHAICRKANPAPRYGRLALPLDFKENISNLHMIWKFIIFALTVLATLPIRTASQGESFAFIKPGV